jgi:hypothetical protein
MPTRGGSSGAIGWWPADADYEAVQALLMGHLAA